VGVGSTFRVELPALADGLVLGGGAESGR